MRKQLLVILGLLSLAGMIYFLFASANRAPQPLNPSRLPPIVDDSMESLLRSLELELERNRPDIIQFLRPGITPEDLEHAEALLGQSIHPEMQALYRWHNGLEGGAELFPGHGFWSLEAAIQTNQELNRQYQKMGLGSLMAHEKNWLIVFPDVAGDGYYYDPKIAYETGGVFYNFREAGFYRYFPSLKNLLQAIVECYQSGVYPQDAEPDFEMEERIMEKYGTAFEDS